MMLYHVILPVMNLLTEHADKLLRFFFVFFSRNKEAFRAVRRQYPVSLLLLDYHLPQCTCHIFLAGTIRKRNRFPVFPSESANICGRFLLSVRRIYHLRLSCYIIAFGSIRCATAAQALCVSSHHYPFTHALYGKPPAYCDFYASK